MLEPNGEEVGFGGFVVLAVLLVVLTVLLVVLVVLVVVLLVVLTASVVYEYGVFGCSMCFAVLVNT